MDIQREKAELDREFQRNLATSQTANPTIHLQIAPDSGLYASMKNR